MVEKQAEQTVTADMPIGDVIQKYPNTVEVFFRHGLGCVGCAAARFENIAQGASVWLHLPPERCRALTG